MTNTTTATDQLAANLAKAEAYEAERARLAQEYQEADARLSAGEVTAEDLTTVSNNATGCERLARMTRELEAKRPVLERQIKLEEAEAWAQELLERMPEGTTARTEAIKVEAVEAIKDTIANAREQLEQVARFGAEAERKAYVYSRERVLPANVYHGGSPGSMFTVDGTGYSTVSASNVGEELGIRVDREHNQAQAIAARDAR